MCRCTENSRTNPLPPAHSRTNLGHILSFQTPHPTIFSALPHLNTRLHPSNRWTGQIPLIEPPPTPAHPAPILLKFPGRQVTALTTQASYSPLLVNPPPTDLHTGSRRDSPPIIKNLPTQTSSTAPTPSISPVLQEPVTSPSHKLVISPPSFPHTSFTTLGQNTFECSRDSSQDLSGGSWTS